MTTKENHLALGEKFDKTIPQRVQKRNQNRFPINLVLFLSIKQTYINIHCSYFCTFLWPGFVNLNLPNSILITPSLNSHTLSKFFKKWQLLNFPVWKKRLWSKYWFLKEIGRDFVFFRQLGKGNLGRILSFTYSPGWGWGWLTVNTKGISPFPVHYFQTKRQFLSDQWAQGLNWIIISHWKKMC